MTSFRQLVSINLSVLAGLAVAGAPTGAEAHPHIFVDAMFEAVAGGDGSLLELRDNWRFDEVFSSSVLLDYDKNRNNTLDPAEIAAVAKTVRESLGQYNYYTNVTINGKAVALAKPDVLQGTYEDGSLTLSFSQKPVQKTPLKGLIVFRVFDPTLYTALDFPDDTAMKTSGDSFGRCTRKVVRPGSKEILAENQAMLTTMFFNDPMGTDYSQIVATRLEVRC
ncbi:DUF1007 family protein [Rhizobium leguminosarum bv. viciae]|uniref:DUF1007 family protein n=1 Tax=Rhizobium ruizarguesonis TaxID=2081791 RepID=UPI00143F4FEA|nr:DUF1007 family protein [Rhizobium ruizarguesonis]NKJ77278.1 DUF1007 family protein [Rhizobium leguminosarum bv. viciae]NKQ72195.1 DUF1007 domain-containing protein [Rhizobium ruizarguesonis]NKQ81587.1 DUF1007 domain-containing protein [Rhizobium ruizarguesonis]